jgi:type II secretory pathway component PulM
MMIFGKQIAARVITMAVAAFLLVAIAGMALSQCSSKKTAKKEAEVAEGQAGAAIDAGAEAVNTAAGIVASDQATDAQVAAAQAEIAAAAKGQKGAAAKRAACRFRAYRDTPQCKEPTQ